MARPRDARAGRPRHGVAPEFEIVPAVPGDLDELERIESRCFDASVALSRRQFRYLLRAPGARVYVLRERVLYQPSCVGCHAPTSLREGACSPGAMPIPADGDGHGTPQVRADRALGPAGQVAGDAIVLCRKARPTLRKAQDAQTPSHPGVSSRLYSLAVLPEYRGKKLGRMLLCHCLAELRRQSALDVTLEVDVENAPAIGLYESLGFVKARRLAGYYGPGRDGWRMKLKFV